MAISLNVSISFFELVWQATHWLLAAAAHEGFRFPEISRQNKANRTSSPPFLIVFTARHLLFSMAATCGVAVAWKPQVQAYIPYKFSLVKQNWKLVSKEKLA
ncbi:MAG: hypothetical protein DRH50_07060 [Deltaproteobacteria bacterium]|nr:MAG: hypothetical protein DRH50_07060 [Deltaproteobacteria bacterium]